MSRLYAPPGLEARHYLNLATINGMDIGSGTPMYERGSSTKDFTVKNDLFMARHWDTSQSPSYLSGYAIEYGSFGSRFSFQLNYAVVMFFQVLTILNPVNTTHAWNEAQQEYLDLYVEKAGSGFVAGDKIWFPAKTNTTCGPFVSEFAFQLPVGQSDIYVLAAWAKTAATQSGHRHISSRVNFIGYKL